ncbi:hypothetical protein RRG08_052827 [Elysia crispata]|uniref:Uncharacterized protein n=1 Tax=Elysia crispata TaxID=231223 RepID=A0AAE1EBE1_9GAST|nr:hypothetical protein RRG08_052827 [Elysia crispata]
MMDNIMGDGKLQNVSKTDMMDNLMGEGKLKYLSTTGMMDNIMGEEKAETCFDNLYDGQETQSGMLWLIY